jgi:hypothetical protein
VLLETSALRGGYVVRREKTTRGNTEPRKENVTRTALGRKEAVIYR